MQYRLRTKSFRYILILVYFILISSPLWVHRYFVSMDGPAHLYNARIMQHLLLGNEHFHHFFEWNTQNFSNWLDHIILALALFIFPAWLAEKVFYMFYIVLFVVSVYQFFKDQEHAWLKTIIVTPFIYTFLFALGFYNFSLGICLLILLLAFHKKPDPYKTWINSFSIAALALVLFFTHAFVFSVYGLFLVFYALIRGWFLFKEPESIKRILFLYSRIFLVHLVALFFFGLQYFIGKTGAEISLFLNKNLVFIVDFILHTRPVIVYNRPFESSITFLLFTGYLLGAYSILKHRIKAKNVFEWYDIFLYLAVVLFVLTMLIPNEVPGLTGFFNNRFGIPMYIFFLCWMLSASLPRHIFIFNVVAAGIVSLFLVNYYNRVQTNLNGTYVNELIKLVDVLPTNALVIPENTSNNWVMPHFENYINAERPDVVVLENYEADSHVFPVIWKGGGFETEIRKEVLQDNSEAIYFLKYLNNEEIADSSKYHYINSQFALRRHNK
ncbi:MAG: hypothetical protein ACOC2F_00065 [Bacteroidota bacterium]